MTPSADLPFPADRPDSLEWPGTVSAGRRSGGGTEAPSRPAVFLTLVGAPLAWTLHLASIYLVVALWCAEGWPGAGIAISLLTLLCAGAALLTGMHALRLWRAAQAGRLTDAEPGGPEPWNGRLGERGARGEFLALLSLFLAGIFLLLILLESVSPIVAPLCPAMVGP